MTMIDPAIGWFEIIEIPTFNLDEVKAGYDEYIDKSSDRVSQLFKNTWLCRYPYPCKFVFDNGSEFKKDFTTLLKDFYIKYFLTKIKIPKSNAPVDRVHQIISNMIVTKGLDDKVFDLIYLLGVTLASIVWVIRDSCRHIIMVTPGQSVFGRDMLFNLASVIDCRVVTTTRNLQVDIDSVREMPSESRMTTL